MRMKIKRGIRLSVLSLVLTAAVGLVGATSISEPINTSQSFLWKLSHAQGIGAVEAIAVLSEDHALYFVSLPSVAEIYIHAMPFQVGDKYIPVSTPADFRFEDVVKLILRLVRLFQAVALYIVLSICHVQAVFQGQFLADTGAAQTLVPVRNGIAILSQKVCLKVSKKGPTLAWQP